MSQKVEAIGKKPLNDGITIDKAGHIVLTDVEHGGLMAFDLESKQVSVLVRSKDVIWPDGVVTGPDRSLYFTDSAIPSYVGQFAAAPDKSTLLDHRPYYIYHVI